jgi:hypothetical protein
MTFRRTVAGTGNAHVAGGEMMLLRLDEEMRLLR